MAYGQNASSCDPLKQFIEWIRHVQGVQKLTLPF